jgi:hypothetical protein
VVEHLLDVAVHEGEVGVLGPILLIFFGRNILTKNK